MSRVATFPRVATLLTTVAVASAARLPGFPQPIAWALGVAAALRLAIGGDGRALLPTRVLVTLAVTATALGSVLLLRSFSGTSGAPMVALLALTVAYQTVLVLARWSGFAGFLVVLLSSVHAAGTAFLAKDPASLAFTLGYVTLLTWSVLLLERHVSASRPEREGGGAVLLRVPGRGGGFAQLRTALAVAACGVVAGAVVYASAPRGEMRSTTPFADASARAREEPRSPLTGETAEGRPSSGLVTGIDRTSSGIRLGDVGQIKRDLTPFFAVQDRGRRGTLDDLYLRGNVADTFVDGGWYPSAGSARGRRYLDSEDGAQDGWIELGGEPGAATHELQITFLEGLTKRKEGWTLLFLENEAVAVRVTRGGASIAPNVTERGDLKRFVPEALQPGDVVDERVAPVAPSETALLAAASDARTGPSGGYVQLPPELAGLAPIARSVVGDETNPWRRAQRLVAWFREKFTYTLTIPDMGVPRERAVLAFVQRVRKGHCEYFATATALMLRSLGHPARVAFGFRGGDLQKQTGTWIVRGAHAHLWPEMWFQGIGWVGLEPTPPDRQAADIETVTRALGPPPAPAGEKGFVDRVLGYDASGRRAFWSEVGRRLGRGFRDLATFAFGPRSGYAGWPVLAAILYLWLRRRARAARVREAVGVGRRLPDGPYGEALLLLSRRGLRRKPTWTARDLVREVATRLPQGAPALNRLTAHYERERFGGAAPGDREARAAVSALDELAAALSHPGGPTAR